MEANPWHKQRKLFCFFPPWHGRLYNRLEGFLVWLCSLLERTFPCCSLAGETGLAAHPLLGWDMCLCHDNEASLKASFSSQPTFWIPSFCPFCIRGQGNYWLDINNEGNFIGETSNLLFIVSFYSCLDHLAVVSMTTEKLFLNINQVCQTYTCALHLLKARKAILRPKADKLIGSMKMELLRI